jgi:hypothetical protein
LPVVHLAHECNIVAIRASPSVPCVYKRSNVLIRPDPSWGNLGYRV